MTGTWHLPRWIPVAMLFASTVLIVCIVGFWVRSYWRCDQIYYGRTWMFSWEGHFMYNWGSFNLSPHPRWPFIWSATQARSQNLGLVDPQSTFLGIQCEYNGFPNSIYIPYGWVLFVASLPADIIGLFWMFRWSRERDAATGGHLTARVVLYLAAAIPVLLFIMFLLCR